MTERVVQAWIDDERARCITLVKAIQFREFLIFCLDNAYTVEDIDTARQRFEELQPGDIEDLM